MPKPYTQSTNLSVSLGGTRHATLEAQQVQDDGRLFRTCYCAYVRRQSNLGHDQQPSLISRRTDNKTSTFMETLTAECPVFADFEYKAVRPH